MNNEEEKFALEPVKVKVESRFLMIQRIRFCLA